MKKTIDMYTATALFCLVIISGNPVFGQLSAKANAKDLLALDPKADSIAGISLYKAYVCNAVQMAIQVTNNIKKSC